MSTISNITQLNNTIPDAVSDAIPPSSVDISKVQWQGWTTIGLIAFMLIFLVAEMAPPYMVMMGILIIFIPLGILTIQEAFHGFADEAMIAVAVLFIVAKGIPLKYNTINLVFNFNINTNQNLMYFLSF